VRLIDGALLFEDFESRLNAPFRRFVKWNLHRQGGISVRIDRLFRLGEAVEVQSSRRRGVLRKRFHLGKRGRRNNP